MNERMTRRHAVQSLLTLAAATTTLSAADQKAADPKQNHISGTTHKDLAPLDQLITRFMREHQVPGASFAVTRKSRLVYARGFGWADAEAHHGVQPESLFRIASVSKPLTAVATLQLAEAGQFALHDHLFDVLPAKDWLPHKHDERLRKITIQQLLQHTGGWDRDASFDPIVRVQQISTVLNQPLPVGPTEVVRFTLTLPLDFDPGARYAYSNVGYLMLGRLIEQVSGKKYEAYVKEHVLKPIGVTRMELGRAWKADLAKGEVRYYDSKHREAPAVNGPLIGAEVPLVYGGENFEAYEAHGGWIATAADLLRFASAFDRPASSKLLKPPSIDTMWACPAGTAGHQANGSPKDMFYGCGWNVRPVGNQGHHNTWHDGLIAGTSTLLVRRHDGFNWAVLFNTDRDAEGRTLSSIIDPQIHAAIDAVKRWPDRSLTV